MLNASPLAPAQAVNIQLSKDFSLGGLAWMAGDDLAPVICLHGLTRNARDFEDLGPALAAGGRRVVALSFRGRGASDIDPDYLNYRPVQYAADVETAMDALEIERAVFIGTSLGGIVTMLLAESAPQRIAGAVLNDIGPELAPEGLARIGAYMAARNADENAGLDPDGRFAAVSFEEAVGAIRAVNGLAYPARPESFWPVLARRTYRETPEGWRLDYDPMIARALMEVGPAPDLWPGFRALAKAAPVLVTRGALSDLLTPPIVEKMRTAAPDLVAVDIPETGHPPLLDEPEAMAAIEDLLARVS